MSLTAEVELALQDKKLTDFFDDHRSALTEAATEAFAYAFGYVARIDLPLRRDDVAKILVPALETNDTLREFLSDKKIREKHWYRDFADLILDRLWEELENEYAAQHP
jgi:hypothetical protein